MVLIGTNLTPGSPAKDASERLEFARLTGFSPGFLCTEAGCVSLRSS